MKIFMLAAVGALLASKALAGEGAAFLNGDWIGTGAFQMGGEISACSEVKMRFGGSKTSYEVREASMTCGAGPKQDFTEIDLFTIKDGGEIVFEQGTNTTLAKGTKVGAVKNDTLITKNPIDTGGVDDISIEKAGDFLIYRQIAGEPGETPAYSLLAILKKDPAAAKTP